MDVHYFGSGVNRIYWELQLSVRERIRRTGGEITCKRGKQVKGWSENVKDRWKTWKEDGRGFHRETPLSLEGYIFPEMLCQHGGELAVTSAND